MPGEIIGLTGETVLKIPQDAVQAKTVLATGRRVAVSDFRDGGVMIIGLDDIVTDEHLLPDHAVELKTGS